MHRKYGTTKRAAGRLGPTKSLNWHNEGHAFEGGGYTQLGARYEATALPRKMERLLELVGSVNNSSLWDNFHSRAKGRADAKGESMAPAWR